MSDVDAFLKGLVALCQEHDVIVLPFEFYAEGGRKFYNAADTPVQAPEVREMQITDDAMRTCARRRVQLLMSEVFKS